MSSETLSSAADNSRRSPLSDVKTLVTLGMLTALAYAVMAICKIIPPIGGFLSLDVKDTVIAIGGFLFGPLAALVMSILVPFLEFLTVSDTGWIGLIMNAIATSVFVCPAVYIYRRKHKSCSAVLGLVVGVLCLTVVMVLWNYILTPIFYHMPREAVVDMLPTLIIPFNLVKGTLNSALIMLLYPPVSSALRKAHLVAPSQHLPTGEKPRFNYAPTAVSAVVLVTAILLVLAMLGII